MTSNFIILKTFDAALFFTHSLLHSETCFTDMTKLETEASGKAATGEVSESTSTKTPADGAADGDTPPLDEGTVCSEENTSPSNCDDKTQACSADSTTQQGETCDTSPGEDPSNTNQDNSNQSDGATGNLSQSNDVSVPDSSGQA